MTNSVYCEHVYKNLGPGPCPKCGLPTHDLDWEKENERARRWRQENPGIGYGGWWSI